MPAGGGVRVEGLNAITRGLIQMGLDVEDLKDAFGSIAEQGARLAAEFAPHRTGRLARAVRGNRSKNKAIVRAGLRSTTPYAGVINYGWPAHNIRASEFMQRADEAMRPFALDELERAINDRIRRRGLG